MLVRRVLVVDDESLNRDIVIGILEGPGLVFDQAVDGDEAVAMARCARYDLILMDMHMPRMDGVAATRRIREIPGYASVPILAVTANSHEEARSQCFSAGMNEFIMKPIEPDMLVAAVCGWLNAER